MNRQLFGSAVWSLMGTVVPMVVALAAVPFLLHHLGQERVGILSLIWVVVGYFSFLDMGLGRAVTVSVARTRGVDPDDRNDELTIVGTSSVLLAGVGLVMALALGAVVIFHGLPFKFSSDGFAREVRTALLWMLPSLPLLLLSSALRGYLEGVGSFRRLNLLRIPTGVLLLALPCAIAPYSPNLAWACVSILVVRLGHVFVLTVLVSSEMGFGCRSDWLRTVSGAFSVIWLRRLMSFGGWVTVSNVVGPLIVYMDRFIVGAALAAGAIASYSVPFDVLSRLPILVAALCSVLLPELARLSQRRPDEATNIVSAQQLVKRSSLLSAGVVFGVVVMGVWFMRSALTVWLGGAFADQSTRVAQILLVAFGVNALAQIPFTALQAAGRVRPVAMLHLSELLPYGALVFIFVSWLGLEGAAWAWLARSVFDYGVLAWMWRRRVTSPR